MHLFLIRHGETDWNIERRMQGHTDTQLNIRGLEQAAKIAARLEAEHQIDVLYSSPLLRARATAEVIGKQLTIEPIFDDRLMEKQLGDLEGMSFEEIELAHPDVARLWRESKNQFLLPGEETAENMHLRVEDFVREITVKHTQSNVAVVSHGGTINMVLTTLLDLDINRRWPFWLDNASISWVDLTGPRPRIRLVNDTCHLRNGHY